MFIDLYNHTTSNFMWFRDEHINENIEFDYLAIKPSNLLSCSFVLQMDLISDAKTTRKIATYIAKLNCTYTCHMIASICFFQPNICNFDIAWISFLGQILRTYYQLSSKLHLLCILCMSYSYDKHIFNPSSIFSHIEDNKWGLSFSWVYTNILVDLDSMKTHLDFGQYSAW